MLRWNFILRLTLLALLLLPAGSLAYEIEQPESYDDILRVVDEEIPGQLQGMQCGGWVGGTVGEVPGEGYISSVEGVPGRTAEPLANIPSGMGVRDEESGDWPDWNGDPINNGYQYPDEAKGLSTRCPTGTSSLPKIHWSYTIPTWIERENEETLYFEDPPCVWRPDGVVISPHSPEACSDFCSILNTGEGFNFRYQYPDCYKIVGGLGPKEPNDEDHLMVQENEDGEEELVEDPNKQTLTCARWCMKNVCTDGWTTLCHPSLKTLTTITWGEDGALDEAPMQPKGLPEGEEIDPDGDGKIEITSKHPNCVECEGEECRCGYQDGGELMKRADEGEIFPACALEVPEQDIGVPEDLSELSDYSKKVVLGCRLDAMGQVIDGADDITLDPDRCVALFDETVGDDGSDLLEQYKPKSKNFMPGYYASFYREYTARHQRQKLETVAPDDVNEGETDVACYGFYREVDHKTFRMVPKEEDADLSGGEKYRRCVINMDLMDRMKTQAGKGEYGSNVNIDEEPPAGASRNIAAGAIWQQIMGGFSLLDARRTTNVARGLLQLDNAATRAVMPLARDGENIPFPLGNRNQGFDDTGDRHLVTWWQGLQNRMTDLANPPVVHLLLPQTWPFGIDDNVRQKEPVKAAADAQERRLQPVDVQVSAAPGVLDEVVGILESGLLFRLEEQRVAIAVFSATPEELRALADAHCLAAMKVAAEKNGGQPSTCAQAIASNPESARIREQLLKYADAAEESRLLRTELAAYVTEMLQSQRDLTEPIRTWLEDNRERYEAYLAGRESLLATLRIWREVEKAMARFPNVPYCMNQRFTTPIYSMLDPWLLSRKPNGGTFAEGVPYEEAGLPNLGIIPRAIDTVLDLSKLELHPTKVQVPVLEPVVWRIDLRRYGPGEKTYPPLADPPSLQPVRDALKSARAALPLVCTPTSGGAGCAAQSPPPIELPALITAEQIAALQSSMQNIREKIVEMSEVYGKFWQAAGPLYPEDISCDTDANGDIVCIDPRTGGRTAGTLDWWLKDTLGGWSEVDQAVAYHKPRFECPNDLDDPDLPWSGWNKMPCFYTENELIEEFVRLMSRPMAEFPEDLASAAAIRRTPSACIPDDEVCRKLPPESLPPAQGWQVQTPKEQRALPDLERKIRAAQFPMPLSDTTKLPPYDGKPDELPPALAVPREKPITPEAPSSDNE